MIPRTTTRIDAYAARKQPRIDAHLARTHARVEAWLANRGLAAGHGRGTP